MQVREPRDHRSRSIVGAHLVLIRNRAVPLGQRHPDSAYAPSAWHLPAGHREQGEPLPRHDLHGSGLGLTRMQLWASGRRYRPGT
ncbi:hypothetical protein SAMN06272765_7407 [Streptomyces sp. Ag109_G2-15]|nr:hypothetical protein SAMN06272765_7407 [Streptomyces sp. Ag109_G2-15]